MVKPESKSSAFPGEPVPTPPYPAARAARALTARWAATAPTGVRRRGGDVPRGPRRRVRGLHAQGRASQGAAGPVGRVSARAPRAVEAPCTVNCDILVHLAPAARPRSRALPAACVRAEGPGSPKEARAYGCPAVPHAGAHAFPRKLPPKRPPGRGENVSCSLVKGWARRRCAPRPHGAALAPYPPFLPRSLASLGIGAAGRRGSCILWRRHLRRCRHCCCRRRRGRYRCRSGSGRWLT